MGMNPASMLGAFRPIPVFDPLAQRQKKAATIVSEVNAQEAQQQQADEKAIRGALQVSGGKLDDNTISKIALVKPAAAQALIKSQHDARTSQYQASKAQLDQQKEQLAIQGTKVAQEGQFFDAILKGADRRLVIESMPGSPEEKQALMGMSEADFQKMAQAKSEMARTWKDRETQAINAATLKEKEAKIEHDKATEEYNRQLRVLTLGKAANEFEHGQVEPATGETKHETLTRTKPPAPSAAVFAATIADPAATPAQKAQAKVAMVELEKHTKATQRPTSVNVTMPTTASADGAPDPTIKAIAEYRLNPTSILNQRGINRQAMMNAILAVNPDYDVTNFPARNKTALDYSPAGASGKALTAADTALAHLHTVEELSKAMKNGDVQQLNRLFNFLGTQTGSAPPENFRTAVRMVAPEITKAVVGGQTSQADRKEMEEGFSSNASDAQIMGAVQTAARLLSERVKKSKHAYKEEMGHELKREFSPESLEMLKRFDTGAKGGDLPKGDGKKIDGAMAKRFVEAAGGDNAKARTLAKEKGWAF